MNQGNPNKVNAIVDEIVENNNVFKLKSPIEQDKEKDSIAQSINSALSVLNEVGKELVLQELSVDPDEKFKGFIDSVGNVDISGLSKMTATIVKEKIIEAEKEGIDLRQGQPVFKDSTKALLVGGVLTVAVIDKMIKDYDNLSEGEKDFLAKNWNNMPYEEKVNYTKALSKNLNEKSNEISNLDLKNEVNNLSQTIEGFDEHMKSVEKLSNSSLIDMITALCNVQNMQQLNLESMPRSQLIETYSNIMSGAYQELINAGREVERDLDEIKYANLDKQNEMEKHLAFKLKDEDKLHLRYAVNYAKLQAEGIIKSDELGGNVFVNLPLQLQSTTLKFVQLRNKSKLTIDEFIKKPFKVQEELLEQLTSQNYIQGKTKEQYKVSQEIDQLPNKLIKEGFSQEEISEALKTYSEFIGGLNGKEDLQLFFDSESPTNEQIYLGLKNVFENFKESLKPNSYKILQQLAQNDFGGHLQEFLTNPQLLQEKFLPALEAEIQKLDKKQVTDNEFEQAKNTEKIKEEFLDASGAIEAQKQQESAKLDFPTPNIPTTPEEHIQESVTSPEQETLEETAKNMAIVEQDNSFIGKIKRVFANMKNMKNKDNSKGFFARLGDSIKNVFGKKNEYFESQGNSKEQANDSSTSKIEQPLSFDQQLQQGVTQPIINQPSKNSSSKGTHNPEKNDDEIEFE